ncbi:hypothetical protein EHE19_000865 [Ruminiclostridium herbifermentans]|uniref:Uncharacterized protein n=1 Tax=Ruminiclostridium herbifermentans TaxID=2488810 RepID=A0A4U7JKW9_9FIRM|nr:hypothetical protein [Ruminiclostridium herbifermentans]QNU67138.1 hypothetical protein EHE19_000865 [Ruminiclostridium herbifermentans]
MGIVYIGLGAIVLAFIILINIADYSILTYKRNAISKAMDYAVNAAVQELNLNQSIMGLADGFSEDTGNRSLDGIKIDIDMAQKTFLTVFYENYNSSNFCIDEELLLCATHTIEQNLKYIIKAGNGQISEGNIENPAFLESRINQAINQYWANSEDASNVFINGNEKTNIIEKGVYLFAFIKDIKIKGLYSQRTTSLSSFAGAKVERKK